MWEGDLNLMFVYCDLMLVLPFTLRSELGLWSVSEMNKRSAYDDFARWQLSDGRSHI